MTENHSLSKQQLKTKETKSRICKAAKMILQEQGYESLSVKNICKAAGVSNGSFFHHFKTKEDLLSYYIAEQPSINPDLLDLPENNEEAKIAITLIYLNYAKSLREFGVDFISNYCDPKNQALNPERDSQSSYPIVSVENYLRKASACGKVNLSLPLEELLTDIRMLIIGNIFEWCLHRGEIDMDRNIRRSFTRYLDSVL